MTFHLKESQNFSYACIFLAQRYKANKILDSCQRFFYPSFVEAGPQESRMIRRLDFLLLGFVWITQASTTSAHLRSGSYAEMWIPHVEALLERLQETQYFEICHEQNQSIRIYETKYCESKHVEK